MCTQLPTKPPSKQLWTAKDPVLETPSFEQWLWSLSCHRTELADCFGCNMSSPWIATSMSISDPSQMETLGKQSPPIYCRIIAYNLRTKVWFSQTTQALDDLIITIKHLANMLCLTDNLATNKGWYYILGRYAFLPIMVYYVSLVLISCLCWSMCLKWATGTSDLVFMQMIS